MDMPEANENRQILSSLQQIVSQQQAILSRQQGQLDNMQEQLGMLTEVATKLAVMEERRAEDKTQVSELAARFEKVRDRVNEKFPQYDALSDIYKAVNNRLWTAIGTGVVGLLLGALKLGFFTG